MRGLAGEQALLRVIVGESQTHERRPLYECLVELLRAEGLAGASVLKGIAGFGRDREIHTIAIEVAARDLPIVVEVVDTVERIERVLPKVDALMSGGIVSIERAHVIRYAGAPSPEAPTGHQGS